MGHRQKGFSLVELAIVLVVVGLLIGGIVVAQSMISTSKITAQVLQIQQFDSAVMNFKTKYRDLPGDALAFGGNGNGMVRRSNGEVRMFLGEIAAFWWSIDQKIYPGYGTICASSATCKANITGADKSVPEAKIGKKGSFFFASPITYDGTYVNTGAPHYYGLLNPTQFQVITNYCWLNTTTSINSSVSPVDLLALDKKADDGVANGGNIIAGSVGNNGLGQGGIYSPSLATCSNTGGVYQVQNSGYECTPLIRIGAQSGDPQ